MDELLLKLSSYGLPGLMAAILCFFLYQTQKQLRESEKARIEDAKASTSLILEIQSKFLESANRIGDAVERLSDQIGRK